MLDDVRRALQAALSSNPANLKGEAVARRMGIGTSSLYRWGESQAIPLDRLVQFTLISRDLRPLQALCRLAGGTFVPVPGDGSTLDQAAMAAIKEFGAFLEAQAKAILDGKVTDRELARIEREGEDAILAIVAIVEHTRQISRGRK